ncbi:hypothetical protein [Burkholderia lata]|uniref:hypothetical protein n=1 Tax=Burkholderia lata (strain ATCC 17760 / DSM 23089 / LMG 22485 / NCIMB 9086 / R18194 / 383) TaxID=482957 RepID=UPI0012EA0C51|nr:hypothetical protein [Burkholderia lata]
MALFSGHFLVRPSAHSDESFLGYRLRVAFANGLSSPSWLTYSEPDLPKTHGVARWCPYCLAASDSYWRDDWYAENTGCFVHKCWLTSQCAMCRRRLRWKHVRFATCSCGASLQSAEVDAFSDDVLRLLNDQFEIDASLLSASDRWSLARFLGALSMFGLDGKPLKKAARQSQNIERIVVTAGAPLMGNRYDCFELLSRLRAPRTEGQNVPLLSEAFPQLLTMLRKHLNDAQRQWMLNLLDQYVEHTSGNEPMVARGRRSTTAPAITDRHGRRLIGSRTIANMLAQTGEVVPIRRTRTGRKRFVVNETDVQRLMEIQRSLVAPTTAARYIGMSVKRIEALTKAGLIDTNERWVNTKSLDRLLESILAAGGQDVRPLDDPISIAEALRLYVSIDASVAFFRLLADGKTRLVIAHDQTPTLRTIYVDKGVAISANRTQSESETLMSVVAAARRLGIKQEVMYHLVNAGLVRTQIARLRNRTTQAIDIDDLRDFTATFLPLAVFARSAGVSVRNAPDWAIQHGIEIVTGPSVDGGRQYWIRKPVDWDGSANIESDD